MNQAASDGVRVTARTSDVSRATTMVRARARKKTPVIPLRKARGMKTTTGVRVEPTSGRTISLMASRMAVEPVPSGLALGVDRLDDDDRVVDDEADGGGDAAQGHQVEAQSPAALIARSVTRTVTGMTRMATSVVPQFFRKK